MSATHVCRTCGHNVTPIDRSKVNGCFFLVLLCFFVVPGILYLVWGLTQRVMVCPQCDAQNTLIPLRSPEARRLASAPATQSGRVERPCPWCAEQILAAARLCKHCGREVDALDTIGEDLDETPRSVSAGGVRACPTCSTPTPRYARVGDVTTCNECDLEYIV